MNPKKIKIKIKNKNLKKDRLREKIVDLMGFFLKVLCLGASTITAYGDDNAFYTGMELGQTKVNHDTESFTLLSENTLDTLNSGLDYNALFVANTPVQNDGFGGRAYLGYQLTPRWAIESGYTQYADTKITNIYGMIGHNEQLSEAALDTVIKGLYPLTPHVHLYAKTGLAFVMTDQIYFKQDTPSIYNDPFDIHKESLDRIRPTYGAGLNWDMTQYLDCHLGFSEVMAGNDIARSSLFSLGFTVYFQ